MSPSIALTLDAFNIGLIAGIAIVVVGFFALILIPSAGSYDRWWERFAASFLSLYILLALLGVGLAIGLAIVSFRNGGFDLGS